LDSICPTGAGKVAGVKIEIHDEKWVGGAEAGAGFELLSAAINGDGREKASAFAKKLRRDESARQEREELLCGKAAGLLGFSRNFEMLFDGEKSWAGE
jgi:hypothetical protein